MNTGKEEKHVERDQTAMKLGDSCVSYEESSPRSVDTEHQLTLLTWMMDPPQGREKESQIRRNTFTNRSYRGTLSRPMPRIVKSMRTIRRQERSLEFSNETSHLLNETYDVQPQLPKDSQNQNGDTSFVEKLSTLTSSSVTSTTLLLLRRMLAMSEEQRYLLEAQIQHERSKRVVTGPLPGM
jgi:hypothetical protein